MAEGITESHHFTWGYQPSKEDHYDRVPFKVPDRRVVILGWVRVALFVWVRQSWYRNKWQLKPGRMIM